MRPITELKDANLEDKTVILRVDYNVPIKDGKVTDDFRIISSLKTINYLKEKGAKIILISHIEGKGGNSLQAVADHINSGYIKDGQPANFAVSFMANIPATSTDELKIQIEQFKSDELAAAAPGTVFLFENLRNNAGEKENDIEFAKAIASAGDIFVGDAFSVSHRKHASIVALPGLFPNDHYAGFQIMDEISHLEKGIHPTHPFIFILGGAKFDTKLPLIEKFLHKANHVVIGGALLNDILKAKGNEVGRSLVSKTDSGTPVDLSHIINDPKIIVTTDVTVKDGATGAKQIKKIEEIDADDTISDVGPSLVTQLKQILDEAKQNPTSKPFILWNGPMGNFEDGFKEQTDAIAKLIIDSCVPALVGGGDTTAAIADLDMGDNCDIYVSTGGGAMIDYLIDESLPGVEALK